MTEEEVRETVAYYNNQRKQPDRRAMASQRDIDQAVQHIGYMIIGMGGLVILAVFIAVYVLLP